MVTFRTLLHGSVSSARVSTLDPGLLVVGTPEQWAWRWEMMTDGEDPSPEPPSVDWSTEVVVLLLLGVRPTTGYDVTITRLVADEQVLEVRAAESRPGGIAGDMVTVPVHAVAIPAAETRDELRLILQITTSPE